MHFNVVLHIPAHCVHYALHIMHTNIAYLIRHCEYLDIIYVDYALCIIVVHFDVIWHIMH